MTIEKHIVPGPPGSEETPVPIRSGPPTRQELLTHYPAHFTWPQIQTFVNSGDLGLLKRHKKLQQRYNAWMVAIKNEHGSVVNYLLDYRLRWGEPDTLTLLPSALEEPEERHPQMDGLQNCYVVPEFFKADIPFCSDLICITQNDWPYSVPHEIEHTLVWSRLPIFHPTLIPDAVSARIQQDGLWGFTGSSSPTQYLPSLESCLPALAEWAITAESMICTPKGTDEEEEMVQNAGREVCGFVRRRWLETMWETVWFVNPPRLQSIIGLAHIHVFARKKS